MKKSELPEGIEEVPDDTLYVEELPDEENTLYIEEIPENSSNQDRKTVDENRKTDILPKVDKKEVYENEDVKELMGEVDELRERLEDAENRCDGSGRLEKIIVVNSGMNRVLLENPIKGKKEIIAGYTGVVLGALIAGGGSCASLAMGSPEGAVAGLLVGTTVALGGYGIHLVGKFKRWYYT